NRLPEVKAFIFEDIPKYDNVVFKQIAGASPVLVVLDERFTEVERTDLSSMTREQCNDLLATKGFQKKAEGGDQVEKDRGDL
ncbi:selenoprotein M-like, partial [Ischnura elegans]|uniref:selenoprotein M-like n=1 Tax=Ischnura elegans TaxID=197161 RepID=UPI001ED88A26